MQWMKENLWVVSVIATVLGAVWWTAQSSSRIDAIEAAQAKADPEIQQINVDHNQIINLEDAVHRIDMNVQWIVQQWIKRDNN